MQFIKQCYLRHFILMSCVVFAVVGCSSNDIQDYANTTPKLALETFFDGDLMAYGMVLDRSGSMQRRFEVKLEARWEGDTGTLDEWFVFDDGEKTTRTWIIKNKGNGIYTGTAGDVIGEANGRAVGSALYWRYDLEIEVDGDPLVVTLDDWMYLINDEVLINKTDIIKFGLKVGEIVLMIQKQS